MKWSFMYDKKRKPLLEGLQPLDHDEISSSFYEWSHFPSRSILFNRLSGELLPVMELKRGNSKFAAKHRRLMDYVSYAVEQNIKMDYVEDGSDVGKSRGLFVTLTVDPKKCSEAESWRIKSDSLKYFKAALGALFRRRGLTGHFVSYHVTEAHSSGYMHIHLFIILEELVDVFLKRSRSHGRYTGSYYWRLQDYELVLDLKKSWSRSVYHALCKLRGAPYSRADPVELRYAFNDVQAVVGSSVTGDDKQRSGVVAYLLKYLCKAPKLKDKKALLTLAYQKLFGVRSIFSKKFLIRIGLGEEYLRHDKIKNELQQLKNEFVRVQRNLGDLYFPGGYPDRLRSYAYAIKTEKIPFEAIEQRILNNFSFNFYSKYLNEIYYTESKKPKIWEFLIPIRYYNAEGAKICDESFRKYRIDWGEISLISDELAPSKIKIFATTWREALKRIICLEGIDDYSPDFISILNSVQTKKF